LPFFQLQVDNNLVLSEQNANASYGNSGYNIKRISYIALNDLLRVRQISNQYSEWRNTSVEHRRIKMVNFAVNDDGSGSGRWKLDCNGDVAPAPLDEVDCDEFNENQELDQDEVNSEEE